MSEGYTQRDDVTRAFVSWAFGLPESSSVEAAEQYLRTQLHPDTYALVGSMERSFQNGGGQLLRYVTEQLDEGPRSRLMVHAHKSVPRKLMRTMKAYESGELSLIPAVQRLVSLMTAIDKKLLAEVTGEIVAFQAGKRLEERLGRQRSIHMGLFLREWDQIVGEAVGLRKQSHPASVRRLQPRAVYVQDQEEIVPYIIQGAVRITDPIHQEHDIHLDEPRRATEYVVEEVVQIPWEEAKDEGLLINIELPSDGIGLSACHTIYLSAERLEEVRSRGTAVTTTIGYGGHIGIHAEQFVDSVVGANVKLPQEALATIRVKQGSIELRRLHVDAKLTVFV